MNTDPVPRVSVVMAAKNYARFLPMAIESVQAQTIPDWELWIVDDGSTDTTLSVVKPYLADARIRYVQSDKLGQSRAKNLGIDLSRATVVAFLDADDAWLPTKLEKQLAMLNANPSVGVVCCLRTLIDDANQPIPFRADLPQTVPPTGRVLEAMFVQNLICFSSSMVRRAVFEHVGRFDPTLDLAIDYDLWLRVMAHYELDCVTEPLVQYRTGHGNLSQKLCDRISTAFAIMARHRDRISEPIISESYAATHRSLAWVLRGGERLAALKSYTAALLYSHGRLTTLKAMLGTMLRRPRATLSPENQSCNR